MRVFIAAPYWSDHESIREENVDRVIAIANHLIENGIDPFIPHLFHYQNMVYKQPEEVWKRIDFNYLLVCDALLRVEGSSKGADDEMRFARKKFIPIFNSLNDVIKYRDYRRF